jgi:glycosyltransferase involved in cell wall biosynthesis
VVIPNPVKVLFSEIPDQFISTFTERKEKEKFIVFTQVAVMLPYKGQKTLIQAFKELVATGINARLLIVGFARTQEHKQYRQELIALAEELGVSSKIDFYSHPGAIGDVWKLTDVHVHTTYLDSLPNALLEAMSMGIPSIISGVGGIPEVIEHEKNGILIPPHNWQKPFEYMQRLAVDEQYRETLGQNAFKTFKQKFEMEKIINDYEDFLINTALK